AGMLVSRVKILENAPKMTALSVNPAVESVRYSPRSKGNGDPPPRGGHRAPGGRGRRQRWRARAADAARGAGATPPGPWLHAPRAPRPHVARSEKHTAELPSTT